MALGAVKHRPLKVAKALSKQGTKSRAWGIKINTYRSAGQPGKFKATACPAVPKGGKRVNQFARNRCTEAIGASPTAAAKKALRALASKLK